MSTLGLAAAVTALAGGLVVLALWRRRRAARPSGPRTVAELVELRAGRAAEPTPVRPAAGESGVRQPAVAPEPADRAPAGPVAGGPAETPAVLSPAGAGPRAAGPAPARTGSGDAPWLRARLVRAAGEPVAAVAGPAKSPVDPGVPAAAADSAPDPRTGSAAGAAQPVAPDASAAPVHAEPPAVAGTPDETPAAGGAAAAPGQPAELVRPVVAGAVVDPGAEPVDPAAVDVPAPTATEHPGDLTDADHPRRALSLVPPLTPPVAEIPPPRPPATGSFPVVRADVAESLAGAADLTVRRTFGLVGPAPDPDPTVAFSVVDGPDRPDEPGPARAVRYRVTHRDGSIVSGAAVSLLDDRGREVATDYADVAGCGQLHAPGPGGYLLLGTAAGHQPGAARVLPAGGTAEVEVLLGRSASIIGVVSGGGGPLAAAELTLVQNGEIVDEVSSDVGGRYRLSDLAGGEYGLSVSAGGCAPVAVLVRLGEGVELRQDVRLDPAGGAVPEQSTTSPAPAVWFAVAGHR